MATYIIGDVQGCFEPLLALLKKIDYQPEHDILWFAGDLVNRGPQSLETLRFVMSLPQAYSIMGNHDMHVIGLHAGIRKLDEDDTCQDILNAPDVKDLIDWLRFQPYLHHDPKHNFTLVHAGLAPQWDLPLAKKCAAKLESLMRSDHYLDHLPRFFGDTAVSWKEAEQGQDSLNYMNNVFTRLRFCDPDGRIDYESKTFEAPPPMQAWFTLPDRKHANLRLFFGHWSVLHLSPTLHTSYCLDTGCIWGRSLTAWCVETNTFASADCKS